MKRVLHIVGGMQRAGAETLLMNLYRNLDREVFQFDFLYFTNDTCDYDKEILELGGNIYRIDFNKKNKFSRIFLRYIAYYKLIKTLTEHQIIHSHINLNGALFIMIAYLVKKKKRISHSHISTGKNAVIPNTYRFICRKIIKKCASTYMACGEAAGKYLYPGISRDKVIVLPNSINIKSFQCFSDDNEFLKTQLGLDKDVKVIVQIGRFTFQKNFEFTVELIKHMAQEDDKIHFVFIGTGPMENEIKQLVVDRHIENYVTFYGVSSEIPKIFHSADLFFMPSRLEGFPVVLVEAQACGIPCLISKNISPEVDMGLGLVSFMHLEDDLEAWKNELYKTMLAKSKDFSEIRKIMKLKNFDAIDNVKKLQKIYSC